MIIQKGSEFASKAFGKWVGVLSLFPAFIVYSIFQKPVLFLGLYAALLPLDQLFVGKSIGALTKWVGGAAALALLGKVAFLNRGKVMRPLPAAWWWIIFFVWVFISSFWAIDPSNILASHIVMRTFELFALYFVISLYPFNSRDLVWLKTLMILGGIAASLYSFSLARHGITWGGYVRLTIVGAEEQVDPNYWATTLLIPFLFSLEWLMSTKSRCKRYLAVIASILILLSILSSGSRGVLLGIIAAIFVFLWEKRRQISWKSVTTSVIVMAIAVFSFYSLAPNALLDRYTFTEIVRTHGATRFMIWKAGVIAFMDSPLYGFGYGNFIEANSQYVSRIEGGYMAQGKGAHNIYLQLAVELGIIGAILFLIVLWKHWQLLRALKCSGNRLVATIKAIFVGMLVIGVTLELLDQKSFWLAFSLIPMLSNIQRQSTLAYMREGK